MLKIYNRVSTLFDTHYKQQSESFKNGFLECLKLLQIGIKKDPQLNVHVENHRLEKEIEALHKTIRANEYRIKELEKHVLDTSFTANKPTTYFKVYNVQVGLTDNFEIVTNMLPETFKMMGMNFSYRYVYADITECKAKMLSYINSKATLGFKAYKDEKTALKDNVKIRR